MEDGKMDDEDIQELKKQFENLVEHTIPTEEIEAMDISEEEKQKIYDEVEQNINDDLDRVASIINNNPDASEEQKIEVVTAFNDAIDKIVEKVLGE